MSKYYIREAGGIQVDRSVDFVSNDLVTFRFIYRADGDLMTQMLKEWLWVKPNQSSHAL